MMMEMRILSMLPDGRFKRSFISFCVIPGSSLIRRFTLAMFGSIATGTGRPLSYTSFFRSHCELCVCVWGGGGGGREGGRGEIPMMTLHYVLIKIFSL